jgi:ferritin-like metal-binding protein YciE
MKASTPQELFVHQIKDIYDAEKQATRIMPKIARACSDPDLRSSINEHLEETRGQIGRIERIFETMGVPARGVPCLGMKGIVEETTEVMSGNIEEPLMDTAILGAARKQEHYEIAAYDAARAMAQALGLKAAVDLLGENQREEIEMDKRLAQAAKRLLREAGRMGDREQTARPSPRGGGNGRASASNGRNTRRASGRKEGQTTEVPSQGRRVSRMTTDHDEIRRWAEERGAHPACVRRTGSKGDIGMIRLDFPGYSGEQSLEPIAWDDWFEKFDSSGLALVYEETTARGQKSNFNKLVSRTAIRGRRTRAAG